MDLMKGVDKFTQTIKAGWRRRAEPIPGRKKLLVLIVVGILFYGGIIALDNLLLRPHLNEIFGEPIDLSYYQERGQAILDGQIPYLDFESESPPLVMYLMVIPQYFGGEMWMYQLYFALFAILTSVSIYLGFRRFNDFYAFTAGISYLFLPYAFIEFTLGVQDEAITALFFVLPLITFIMGRMAYSGFLFSLGIWTKFFDILLLPWAFLKARTNRDRAVLMVVFAGLSLAVALPFLICCPEEFLSFPSYYFLGDPRRPDRGFWNQSLAFPRPRGIWSAWLGRGNADRGIVVGRHAHGLSLEDAFLGGGDLYHGHLLHILSQDRLRLLHHARHPIVDVGGQG